MLREANEFANKTKPKEKPKEERKMINDFMVDLQKSKERAQRV